MLIGKPSSPRPREMNGRPILPRPGSGLYRIQLHPRHSQPVCLCFLHRVFKKTSPNGKVSPCMQRRDRVAHPWVRVSPRCRLCWGSSGVALPTGWDAGWVSLPFEI